MVLETPDLSYIRPSEARRMFCVTTIRRDARTGAVRVTVAGKLVVLRNGSESNVVEITSPFKLWMTHAAVYETKRNLPTHWLIELGFRLW